MVVEGAFALDREVGLRMLVDGQGRGGIAFFFPSSAGGSGLCRRGHLTPVAAVWLARLAGFTVLGSSATTEAGPDGAFSSSELRLIPFDHQGGGSAEFFSPLLLSLLA